MSMDSHVSSLCKSAYYQLRNVNSIRNVLSRDATEQLIHAFVTSRLDNGNSLLSGISKSSLRKLQCVQNAAARTIMRTRKYDHITPVLIQLHWLPVEQRILFKIRLLTWKAMHGLSPPNAVTLQVGSWVKIGSTNASPCPASELKDLWWTRIQRCGT